MTLPLKEIVIVLAIICAALLLAKSITTAHYNGIPLKQILHDQIEYERDIQIRNSQDWHKRHQTSKGKQ